MDDTLATIHETLQDSLDIVRIPSDSTLPLFTFSQVVSARSSSTARSRALESLQRLVIQTFGTSGNSPTLREFLSLQNTFECNGER